MTDAPHPIDALILLVNQHQCNIRNLFQNHNGWQANIGNGTDVAEFGTGATMYWALEDAVEKAIAKGFMKREKPSWIREPKPVAVLATTAEPNASPDPFDD
ncbi:MAG: hypothetical protein KG075_23850 [Alphaproteobacteria bacterium]|nr:hypothetical protein [Alphaproteobacteria bacterium]